MTARDKDVRAPEEGTPHLKPGMTFAEMESQKGRIANGERRSAVAQHKTARKDADPRPAKPGDAAITQGVDARDIARLRTRLYNIVTEQTERALEVMEGKRSWNQQQVNLYRALLNKCVPDLKHTLNEVRHNDATKLTREELEKIIHEDDRDDTPPG
ncbi:hypothetical protein GCM10023116_48030 [Kistimonas scapharcae]|uniref:Terminase small subunit n=1 Tax=Kistimonas scapharcae TaxID=1036133 RepID=A0ABP8VAH2_9GAMM